jgi:hypothetical protein
MTFVRLVQTQIAATTGDSEHDAGYREGLTAALSLMLQATVDEVPRS